MSTCHPASGGMAWAYHGPWLSANEPFCINVVIENAICFEEKAIFETLIFLKAANRTKGVNINSIRSKLSSAYV